MTVVACKVTETNIQIASDSQTTWGDNKMPTHYPDQRNIKTEGKLFTINTDTVIGCAGRCSHITLLQMYCRGHLPVEMTNDRIFDWFADFKKWANVEAQVKYEDLSIHGIIVKDKKAFTFYDDLEVREITDFSAVGSGMFLAIGVLDLGADVEAAVNVAIKYDLYCGGKANVITILK